MFILRKSNKFIHKSEKLIQKNPDLIKRIDKALTFLRDNPKHPGLRTHQINDSDYGKIWSSWVHGDLRIFWKYEGEVIVILLLDIGSHDEVY